MTSYEYIIISVNKTILLGTELASLNFRKTTFELSIGTSNSPHLEVTFFYKTTIEIVHESFIFCTRNVTADVIL